MVGRICYGILIVAGSFFIPPLLMLPIAIGGLLLYERFYEIFLAGFIIDLLYGVPTEFAPIPLACTFLACILWCATALMKKRLKFY